MKLKVTLRGHFCPDITWVSNPVTFFRDPDRAKQDRLESVLRELASITEIKWNVLAEDKLEGTLAGRYEQYVIEPGIRNGARRTIYWEIVE